MSYENRKREYERVLNLGKTPPERLIVEFGAVITPKENLDKALDNYKEPKKKKRGKK